MSWNLLCKSSKSNIQYNFYQSAVDINPEQWELVSQQSNIYLSLPYLHSLELAMEGAVDFRYIMFYNEQQTPVAIAAVQILDFSNEGFKYNDHFCKVREKLRNKLLKAL